MFTACRMTPLATVSSTVQDFWRGGSTQAEVSRGSRSLAAASDAVVGLMATTTDVSPHERLTMDLGSAIVAGALGLGMEVGRWPLWSVLLGLGGYVLWTLLYAELTVRSIKWRRLSEAGGLTSPAEP
jgi:hypothetical protein